MAEAALSNIVEARRFRRRFREIETCDCAALTPRDEIEPAPSLQIGCSRTGATATRSVQDSADPQHRLVEQTCQFGEVTCTEAPDPTAGPASRTSSFG
jgi:hypothetical protein